MAKILGIYKCEVCGNIVEVLHEGKGELVCCGQPMNLCKENTTDGAREKHVPVIEKLDTGVKVRVGSAAHPMEQKHYIEWIEVFVGGKVLRQALEPGDQPLALFDGVGAGLVSAREYCNIHGLWKS